MTKAELESKHLSELHALAAKAGVERYRMLPRAELIDALAEGGGSGGSGGGRRETGSGRSSGSGRDRSPRDGRSRRSSGQRQRRRPPREDSKERSSESKREEPRREEPKPEAATPAPSSGSAAPSGEQRPRRRRRRFRRRGGKAVRAHELILAAPGGQSVVLGDSRAACTSLLRELAGELSGGRGPDPIALLVDPSPEELAEWKREAPKAEIVSAGQERHAEDALAQAARRAQSGEAVILLLDSASRVAETFGGNVAKDLLEDGRSAAAGASGSLTFVVAIERG